MSDIVKIFIEIETNDEERLREVFNRQADYMLESDNDNDLLTSIINVKSYVKNQNDNKDKYVIVSDILQDIMNNSSCKKSKLYFKIKSLLKELEKV